MRRVPLPARHRSTVVLALALAAALAAGVSGLSEWGERALAPLRHLLTAHPASGEVVVVEMDAASVAAIARWPWPRGEYVAVVDRLRRAGARSITFDVDFSSASTPGGDAAFAAALARVAGRVALPTFAQEAGSGDSHSVDALPIASLRPHAALVSVSMQPDDDGLVRRAPYGTVTADTPRPSLSAHVARQSGRADTFFPIDWGIDPASVPRLSFVAVRDGRFDPAAVRGRDVVIGATAIEMGDRYATPRWGVIPGVVVQAVASETLLAGPPVEGGALPMLLAALALGAAVLRARGVVAAAAVAAAAMLLIVAVAIAAQILAHRIYPLAPPIALLATVSVARAAFHLVARFDRQRATDEATALPNRVAMLRRYEADAPAAVVVLLLANVEALLTVLGNAAERDLILRLAERIEAVTGSDAVFRLSTGTIAFATAERGDLDQLMPRWRAALLQPLDVAGRRVDPAVHLGWAEGDADVPALLRGAAQAAARAATERVFWRRHQSDTGALEREVTLMGDLDRAIAAGEIGVHYQPKLSLADDRITGVEALVRWHHPDRGTVRPDEFIPLAEQTDRIAPLTLCVLRRVLADLAGWRRDGIALTAAVNVSARLVADDGFGAEVRALIAASPVPPAALILEVTESATLADPDRAAAALRGYRELGCSVSMDDYGTGQSTLSYLQRLPLSELKIDRSFVANVHRDRADAAMVRSTIDLAHQLGIKVVAEGIEDAECLDFLREAGCDMAQGYHIGRPVPEPVLREQLTARLAA